MTRETVVRRQELLDLGWGDHDIRRALRRREMFIAHRGVYITHNGTPSWSEQARIAVLSAWPAVLSGASALRADGLDLATGPILIAVDHDRRPRRPAAPVRRKRGVLARSRTHLTLPRESVEEAAIDIAAAATLVDAAGVLTAVCGARLTTPTRLLDEVERRSAVPRRPLLRELILDAEQGTHSALEHAFLARVERPHGLPTATRQAAFSSLGARGYRDAAYEGVIVELDGRRHATTFGRDIARDLHAAAEGLTTIRLGWEQTVDSPCRTADILASVLQRHGWRGRPSRCGPSCVVGTASAIW